MNCICSGVDASKDLRVEFKKTKGQATAATVTNGASSVESQLIPTLFDINLSVKKVEPHRIFMLPMFFLQF